MWRVEVVFDLLALIHNNHGGESGGRRAGLGEGTPGERGHQKLFLNERKRGINAEE